MTRALRLLMGAGLVFAVLILPNHPVYMTPAALLFFPLELPAILFLVLILGRLRGVVTAIAILLVAITLLKLADYATELAYARPFDPILDLFLIKAGLGLLRDSIGMAQTVLAVVAAGLLTGLFFVGLRAGLLAWARLGLTPLARTGAVAGFIGAAGLAVADTGHHLGTWTFDQSPPGTAWTTRLTLTRAIRTQELAADLVRFRQEAQRDALDDMPNLLDRLAGRDVHLIWVESYGRASFDNPLYAPTHLRTFTKAETALADKGLAMKSGWLTSPTAGGQSWLAHGALASGLWTSNQGRYTAMIASGRKWLFHFAQEAGYRTAAIMSAITLAWPESAAMGFDRVFAAKDIPYAGKPFNWVTMPDQYTLSVIDDLLPPDERPDFLQIALISSHAPWTPVPQIVDWDSIGDGRIFDDMADAGPSPRELWKDEDDIRDAYRQMVDYALKVAFAHVARAGDEAPLYIIAGDHQAAGFVAGGDNRDVAVHMIGPPELIDMIDGWGWADGLIPAADGPVRPMNSFRDDFLRAFTTQPKPREGRS